MAAPEDFPDGPPAVLAEERAFSAFLAERRQATREAVDWASVYQDFLSAFAPERRRALGVYYTPAELVGCQVRLASDVLERRLDCRGAFADQRVLVVDPACGSGAYPLAVVADVKAHTGGVPQTLGERLWLVEPTPAAASIARTRLGAALGGETAVRVNEGDALQTSLGLDAPVVVCLGNPPYRRLSAQTRAGSPTSLTEFLEPGAGLHAKNLYNDYVYFWRWGLREVFERRHGPGVLSFVSASSFLRGPGFAGLRHYLRRVLDELWILDLEGDHLAARGTHNVFPIRTPVAVAMGVRYPGSSSSCLTATVHYARLVGSRSDKLAALDAIHTLADVPWQSADAGWRAPFVPPSTTAYTSWPSLTDIFPWQLSGAQLKRTWPIAPAAAVLYQRWQRLLDSPSGPARAQAFRQTRDRDLDSTPADLFAPGTRLPPLRGLLPGTACIEPVPYAYRSFDRQWVLPDARLGDFMRPALWRIAGPRQIFLTSLLTNVLGAGPAAVATALVPDMDCFRGSFGAKAVIPLWRDALAERPNVAEGLLDRLSARYRAAVGAGQLLAYCYALLGTRSYQNRFEEELRTPGPRVPLTANAELFQRASALGQQLLALHTRAHDCVPTGQARTLLPIGSDYPRTCGYDAERQVLHVGDGAFGPVEPPVWAFGVSGLRVVAGWLGRRVARRQPRPRSSPLDDITPSAWTAASSEELLALLWLVEATLASQPAQDAVLDEIVAGGQLSNR